MGFVLIPQSPSQPVYKSVWKALKQPESDLTWFSLLSLNLFRSITVMVYPVYESLHWFLNAVYIVFQLPVLVFKALHLSIPSFNLNPVFFCDSPPNTVLSVMQIPLSLSLWHFHASFHVSYYIWSVLYESVHRATFSHSDHAKKLSSAITPIRRRKQKSNELNYPAVHTSYSLHDLTVVILVRPVQPDHLTPLWINDLHCALLNVDLYAHGIFTCFSILLALLVFLRFLAHPWALEK